MIKTALNHTKCVYIHNMRTFNNKKIVFIMDLDGVLTDGTFLYDETGKRYKKFGPDDADALNLIKNEIEITVCSADHRGFDISEKRVNDMGFALNNVKQMERLDWINRNYPSDRYYRIYMGDSFVDAHIMQNVDHSICPRNGHDIAKRCASYVSNYDGGNRAVCDAVFHIMTNFLNMNVLEACKVKENANE